jgi:branched-chain amino acid transport system permease protein
LLAVEEPSVDQVSKPLAPPGRFTRLVTPFTGGVLLFVVATIIVLTGTLSEFAVFEFSTVVVFAIAALGQDWLIGSAGQVSIGGAAFMAVGAFTVSGTVGTPLGSWPLQLLLVALVGAVFGVLVGFTSFRLSGLYLFLSTLAFQFIISFWTTEYQGDNEIGYSNPPPSVGAWHIASADGLAEFALVAFFVVAVFTFFVRRRAPGRYWRAIRESEIAAGSIGIDVRRWKLTAFVGSSVITALAGGVYAWVEPSVTSAAFSLTLAISIAVMVFFGGRGTIIGPLLGAAAITLLPEGLTTLSQHLPAATSNWMSLNSGMVVQGIIGLVLVLVLLLQPQGLVGVARGLLHSVTSSMKSDRVAMPTVSVGLPAEPGSTLSAVALSEPPTPDPRRLIVEVSNLSVRYPNGATGIDDVSISVEQGTIFAVIGRNGAGKSSLMKGIVGFSPAERVRVRGGIRIDGAPLLRNDPRAARKLGVGWVPERDKAFADLTVMEHLQLTGVDSRKIEEILESLPQLAKARSRRAGFLSGGERQLLALAAAIAPSPKILFIDEPSLGLSPIATEGLMDQLVRLREEQHITVVMTEQVIETLEEIADRFIVLDAGHVAVEGDRQDLAKQHVRDAAMGHR